MSNKIKEGLEVIEELKDVVKHQYDYYKHMTIINSGSILVIIALFEGVFKDPKGIEIIIISIASFVVSLVCSLEIMSTIGNLVLNLTEIHGISITQNKDEANKILARMRSTIKQIQVIDELHRIFFYLGIGMLVYFAIYNFLQ